ncbi:MAG: flagellar hook-length control protein FliK, partial [Paracoccaceae bacterium]|nr:flagellar hook-length control protein FliK [Paracoccaceae bacterium]
EKKSQNMIAKGLSIAFSQLQALVSKVKLASKNNNGEVIASNPDAGKVTDLLGTLKGIDLSKLFTYSDKSTAFVDIELNGTNPPTIDEFMTILNKVKSENDSLSPIKSAEMAQVTVAKEIASEGARTLALPMRTSDVVFVSESDIVSVPIKNLPQALRETSIPLEQLSGETNTADLSNIKENVSGQHPLTPVITPVSIATEKLETVSLELTEADVEAAPVRDLLSKPDEKIVVKLDQVFVHGENVVPKKTLIQTIETELVTVAKTAETISSKLLEDFEAQGIKPLSKVVKNSVQSVPARDIPKIKVDAEIVKVPVDRAIQLTDETAATSAKLNLDLNTENNTIAVTDGAVGAAELTASGKVVKSDINAKVVKSDINAKVVKSDINAKVVKSDINAKAVKSDMTAQQKSLPNDISLKEPNIDLAPKVTRVAIADVSEFKPEVAAQKPEVKISSSQDKHITDNVLKDNSNLEKGFSKMAAAKQAVLGRKAMETQVADRFNIQPPKMRPLSTAQNTALDSKSVTDFVARTAQAFVSQQQGIMRKKLTGDTPDASNTVGVNTDAASYQQIAASSGSQSQTGQGSGGSNMLEKWADTHLDLSSRGWATNMAKTMISALNRGQERLMFSLSPPSLGRISIAFTSTRGALDVRIQAERKATIALLGDAEGKLTSNLESAGHRVNSLSYAEMNSGETKFDFDHNQSSNNESKGKGKRDSSQAEKPAKLEAEAESSVVSNKKADDSLVNITV